MSGKSICLGVVAASLLGIGVARGQGGRTPLGGTDTAPTYPAEAPYYPPPAYGESPTGLGMPSGSYTDMPGGAAATGALPTAVPTPDPSTQPLNLRLNNWLSYPTAPGCCGPLGLNGPIGSELYLRNGITLPMGGGVFSNLESGWIIEGGGRVLLFEPSLEKAWTVDLGITNIYSEMGQGGPVVQLFNYKVRTVPQGSTSPTTAAVPEVNVTVRSLNQTFVNAAFGREYWLWGTGNCSNTLPNWRAGWDVGGRYGTAKANFNEVTHTTDVLGGLFLALHTDVEIPWNCCIFQVGFRAEWGYVWSDILQSQNISDTQSINLLITGGMRF